MITDDPEPGERLSDEQLQKVKETVETELLANPGVRRVDPSPDDVDTGDEQGNVPETEPDVEEERDDTAKEARPDLWPSHVPVGIPDRDKFEALVKAAAMLDAAAVGHQIGRLVQAGVVPDKNNWKTDQKHLLAARVAQLCHDRMVIVRQWPLIRFLRGGSLGNPRNEVRHLMSFVILGELVTLWAQSEAQETGNVPQGE